MNKIFYLSTCDTCKRILQTLQPGPGIELQDLKIQPLNAGQVDALHSLAGSYEALFNKRAQLYRKNGLHEQDLSEADYRKWLLAHYTFLKRPVIVLGNRIFIGNSKKTVAAAAEALKP
ncbi:ArsC/Spx/MgsR family protein [Robiginitalea sp. M366]|uniref:arsenate reductase family protein n=1 Tax=Robiginitalea aestuariiviva TaxID=3036903 RepID=UPI00240E431D|nr:ArsC/Spx/MgsR family protein [Robiginitalea aestuariiviva]MDG1571654.1 ArsC/Spx/MgsR family protein [Robiginitalea aestuariiviva]